MTPGRAIRKYCINCVSGVTEVKDCRGDKCLGGLGGENGVCYLFPYRMGKGRPRLRTIKRFCIECQGGDKERKVQKKEILDGVRGCLSTDCWLYPFRIGKNPNIKDGNRRAAHFKKVKKG